jgi:hypothetical protein
MNHSTNHPLIPNSQEYMLEKKYVTINSEDIDCLKYPSTSDFIIELPQDYCNVQGIKLSSWAFPSNLDVFSKFQNNVTMSFNINSPYNPGEYMNPDPLLNVIFAGLYAHVNTDFIITIDDGIYTAEQITTELTNRFNAVVTAYLVGYITANSPSLLPSFIVTGYDQFVIVYNKVTQKLWFGNKSSGFILTNDSSIYSFVNTHNCLTSHMSGSFVNWGLPAYLGFTRVPGVSTPSINGTLPRFYYGNVKIGDAGFWLLPDSQYIGASVNYLEAPGKLNLLGNLFFYMEVHGMNTIDETIPFVNSKFTSQTNETNGVVNASFAKILISSTTSNYSWIPSDYSVLKVYNPPAERIRRLKIKFRYHNGELVNFGNLNYSILLEMIVFKSQNNTKTKMYIPEGIIVNFN